MPVNYAGTASDQRIVLLSNAAGTGAWQAVSGGQYTFAAWGAWGGATMQLQWSDTAGLFTAFDVQGMAATADIAVAGVPMGVGYARAVIIGGTGANLNATLSGVSG